VKYWRLKLAAQQNNYDATATLLAVNELLPLDLKIASSLLTTAQSLNQAKRNLTTKRHDAYRLRQCFLQEL
jgi:hypothetical protein